MKKQTFLAFGAGCLNGMFGFGGGMLVLPMLTAVLQDEKEAQRASAFFLLPLSCVSAAAMRGETPDGTWILCLGALTGGALGTFLASRMRAERLKLIFAVFLIASGVRMLW
ncbi:MAG: sulfite exporter TauE/SafE family protein [Clostridia bacterium]|nr:sulfite exporter TauE/SafE family protein [Clostridia bacterium]